MRLKIVAGNWKMNKTFEEVRTLSAALTIDVKNVAHPQLLTILAPPYPFIHIVAEIAESTNGMSVAGQNCHEEENGAFTGEVSAAMVKSCGAQFVIIGHSERRIQNNETNDVLLKKTKLALAHNLKVIFCIGETKEQRDIGKHFETIQLQLDESIFQLKELLATEIVIACEPVWAIGTGENASPNQVQEMHEFIRKTIAINYNSKIADEISIIYGGSINADNASELFACKDVDGGLIGGASLNKEDFSAIRKAMVNACH